MKKLIFLITFLCLCVPAYASRVVTPAPSGQGTYAELDGDGNLIVDGYIESTGDPSYMKLNNNTTDTSGSGYFVHVIGGLWYQKVGTQNYPLTREGGINPDLSYLLRTGTNPIARAFEYPLTYPLLFDERLVPIFDPYQAEVQEAGARYVFACAMKNITGGDLAWNTANLYTATLFGVNYANTVPALSVDYMEVTATDAAWQDLYHRIGADGHVTGVELVGEIDMSDHDIHGGGGVMKSDIGISVYGGAALGWFPMLSIGYDSSISTVNYAATDPGNPGIVDTGIPLSTGKIAYKLSWQQTTGRNYTYIVEINGTVLYSGTGLYSSDFSSTVFSVAQRVQGGATYVGTTTIDNYGFLLSYTK